MLFLTTKRERNECLLIPREDMAMLLGCTTETASRVVAEFKRKGLVHMVDDQGSVCSCDVERLDEIAAT